MWEAELGYLSAVVKQETCGLSVQIYCVRLSTIGRRKRLRVYRKTGFCHSIPAPQLRFSKRHEGLTMCVHDGDTISSQVDPMPLYLHRFSIPPVKLE